MQRLCRVSAALVISLLASLVLADDLPELSLVLKDHVFRPSEIRAPAGVKFKIILKNQDITPEEFESTDFGREKIVLPDGVITVYAGPLKAGTYRFFGDFHQNTAQGRLIVE